MAADHLTVSTDWASIIASICGVILFISAVAAYLARRFSRFLDAKLTAIDRKATPNGGNTLDLGDTAARIETKVDETRSLVLYHIQNHPGPSFALPVAQRPELSTPTPTRAQIATDNGNDSHRGDSTGIATAGRHDPSS